MRFFGALALCCTLVIVMPSGAWGVVLPPTVKGSIEGSVKAGGTIVFRIDATDPSGYQNVADLQAALLLHSVILDQIDYNAQRDEVSTPSSLPFRAGSRSVATGPYLEVSGRGVVKTTSGNRFLLIIRARVIHDIPAGSQFALGVIDIFNRPARVFRPVEVPSTKGGFSWSTLGLAIVVALFLGGFVGNLFSSRRPSAPKTSVYDAMRRRLEETKTAK